MFLTTLKILQPINVVILAVFALASCASVPELNITSTPATIEYIKQPNPKPVKLKKIEWVVITEQNFLAKFQEIKNKNGRMVLFALTPEDYEKLSLNVADIKRYLEQNNEIIVYYETILDENSNNTEESNNEESDTSKDNTFFGLF